MERNKVILVDENDLAISEIDKMEAHIHGYLHRAFSIFIFNSKGEMLLQQRASNKYHGANLWTNACCSHPQWNENVTESAKKRLIEEMGIHCDLRFLYTFIYKAEVENNLIEHELDHIFLGFSDAIPNINPNEVQAFKWVHKTSLEMAIKANPNEFTYWFKEILPQIWNKILS